MQPDDDVFLTIAEVAGRLRVSKMTIYRLYNTGQLGGVRVGRSIRILAKELDRYLKENT